jgi:class 3 adenylate cyclase/CHASE2 domain-containing sensor protein
MTRLERKLLLINGVLGTTLTVVVLLLDQFHHLDSLEHFFYDQRAAECQFFMKPASDRIVYLDIDDGALETIGRWPWNRDDWARIIDEITAAKPKLIFLDILFSEPQKPYGDPQPDGTFVRVDHDPPLAAALHRAGNALVPLSLDFAGSAARGNPADRAIYEALLNDLELTPAEVSDRLSSAKIARPQSDADFNSRFVAARRSAMSARIARETSSAPGSIPELRKRLLPKTDSRLIDSPLIRLLAEEYDKLERLIPLQRFMLDEKPGLPPLMSTDDEIAPLAILGRQAASSGFVNCLEDTDGVVRRIPLFMRHRGQIIPQVGLVIACQLLGVDPKNVQITSDRIAIPCPDGRIINLPVVTRKRSTGSESIGTLMNIPFFGSADWKTKQHVPMNLVWQVFQIRKAIMGNNETADRAISDLDELFPDDVAAYIAKKPDIADPEARLPILTKFLETIDGFLKQYKDAKDLTEMEKKQIASLQYAQSGMIADIAELRRLAAQLQTQRDALQTTLAGKAVLIGSVAGSSAFDLKPTPIHEMCPGIVVHGVIANGILTNELWFTAPNWITGVLTLFMGLATTAFVLRLKTSRAAIATLSLAALYLLFNGIFLFDYHNVILGVAGPIVAMLITWLSCQLVEILIEKAERRRITKRFRSYVDPALVRYVIEHPEQDVMSGHEREMTVVFTDLAGFTTISETLKNKVIPLLNEYLGMMVTIIRKHHGYVNKFLGDGIMFFYNAPWDNPNHAADAISTVMEMQDAMIIFNQSLIKRGLPALTMRAGITTGPMVVGDAGSSDGSDYTVIGDNVNLAARLESANKATDTKVMMTARTCELLGDRFLVRPTARLQVKGKTEGVDTCELIARADQATDKHRLYAQLGKAVFDAFVKSDFAACLKAVEQLEAEFGKTKLTKAYHELSEQYLKEPPKDDFKGEIILHEK